MNYSINKLLIDNTGNFVTVKSKATMRDKNTMEVLSVTIEVKESDRKYQPAELSEPTDEQYQEYISNEE
jgi:hypothetical protein